jgi:Holliday junction resolvase
MSKGTRRERELVELLQKAGMATYRPATVRYGENDMFGLFDVLAVSPSHTNVYAIQVKSNRATGIRKWANHTQLFRNLGWITMYAVPVDNKGWRLIDCSEDGNVDVVDERDSTSPMGMGVLGYFRYVGDDI